MRKIIFIGIICCLGGQSFAIKKTSPILVFYIKSHHGAQKTEIFKENKNYYCKTELVPYFSSSIKPFSEDVLKKVRLASYKSMKVINCRDRLIVFEYIEGLKKTYLGCAETYPFADLVRELSKNCGRN